MNEENLDVIYGIVITIFSILGSWSIHELFNNSVLTTLTGFFIVFFSLVGIAFIIEKENTKEIKNNEINKHYKM